MEIFTASNHNMYIVQFHHHESKVSAVFIIIMQLKNGENL